MQEIYILRHGHAIDLQDSSSNDFDRYLTDDGKKKIKKLADLFNNPDFGIEIILSSPYIRAKETAEIFIGKLDKKPEFKIVDFLSSGASVGEISKGLMHYSLYKSVLIVGHSPDLEIFLGRLIGAENIKLKKGALAKVKLDNSVELAGELEWLIIPKLLKKLKSGREIKT